MMLATVRVLCTKEENTVGISVNLVKHWDRTLSYVSLYDKNETRAPACIVSTETVYVYR